MDRTTTAAESSDTGVMDLLRRRGPLRITDLSTAMGVTSTAVRQRLVRLMEAGFIDRQSQTAGRGRPSHYYGLTELGRRQAGTNFADLAVVLWQELRSISDPEVRRGLLRRISHRLAKSYMHLVSGETPDERMKSLAALLSERDIPFDVQLDSSTGEPLPVLTAVACPYTDLADVDRSVCSMEKMLFAELIGHGLVLKQCRLDGKNCCTFELN